MGELESLVQWKSAQSEYVRLLLAREVALNDTLNVSFAHCRSRLPTERYGFGISRSLQIFLARRSFTSESRGTAERLFLAGFPHHE